MIACLSTGWVDSTIRPSGAVLGDGETPGPSPTAGGGKGPLAGVVGDVERTGGAREQEPPQFGPVPRVGLREDALQMRPAAAPATATSLTLPPPGTRTATSASASVRLYSPVPPDRKPTSRLPPGTPLPARHV